MMTDNTRTQNSHNMINSFTRMSYSKFCIYYLYIMTIYLSFETPILNIVPERYLFVFRYGIEGLGYVLLVLVFLAQWGNYKFENLEIIIISSILITVLNVILYVSDLRIAVQGFRWIYRYIYIFFLIVMINWTPFYIRRFFRLLAWIIRIEMILAILQLFAREYVNPILKPSYANVVEGISSYASQKDAARAIYASFGRYSEFGYFILLALWMYIACYAAAENKKRKRQYFVHIVIWGVLLIFSYCRQATVAVLLSVLLFMIAYKQLKMTKSALALMILGTAILIPISILLLSGFEATYGTIYESISQRFLSVFSVRFMAMDYQGKGRSWFYTQGLLRLLRTRPILGYGLGRFGCQTAIQYDQSVHQALNIPTRFSMDAYYVSVIGQLGLIGAGMLFAPLLYCAKKCKEYFNRIKTDNYLKQIHIMTYGYIMCGIITALFSSSLSDRYLAFYLWVLIGICQYCRIHNMELDHADEQ